MGYTLFVDTVALPPGRITDKCHPTATGRWYIEDYTGTMFVEVQFQWKTWLFGVRKRTVTKFIKEYYIHVKKDPVIHECNGGYIQ